MTVLERVQAWYRDACDGDWEHRYGVRIETLDNPGWHVSIELTGTAWAGRSFPTVERGTGRDAEVSDHDWLTCSVRDDVFHGYGGPEMPESILGHFLDWSSSD